MGDDRFGQEPRAREALCIVVTLTDGSEYTYRGDNGAFLKKQIPEG